MQDRITLRLQSCKDYNNSVNYNTNWIKQNNFNSEIVAELSHPGKIEKKKKMFEEVCEKVRIIMEY